MRDLGKMGESAFSHLCASAGLTANSSDVDKTGWDFLVEFNFPIESKVEVFSLHSAAPECKVQIKSTDDRKRKISVKLSNLKRLATTPSPAFFAFFEFNGEEDPQDLFVVHLDSPLISNILRRLHEVNLNGETHQLHKKTMTIKYDDSHRLQKISGKYLAQCFRDHIGPSMVTYVDQKNHHLKTNGFEDGFAEITFEISNAENLSKFVDSSIGIQQKTNTSNLVGFKKRFNIKDTTPFVDEKNLTLEFIDVKPSHEGTLQISLQKNGPAFSFPAQLYVPPFLSALPIPLRRSRLATDFFSFVFNPYTNECTFLTNFKEHRYEIHELKRNFKFLQAISKKDQILYARFTTPEMPPFEFNLTSSGMEFDSQKELMTLDAGVRIISNLNIFNQITITIDELLHYSSRILEMDLVFGSNDRSFRIEIPKPNFTLRPDKDIACLSFLTTPIGQIHVGAFTVMIGKGFEQEDGSLHIYGTKIIAERIFTKESEEKMSRDDLVMETREIIKRYELTHQVVTRIDERNF